MSSLAIAGLLVVSIPTLFVLLVVAWHEGRERCYAGRRYALTPLAEAAANDPLTLWYELGPNPGELGELFTEEPAPEVVDEHCL